jgi:pimeloyl-ACP methyl ester carboxylesterase
MFFLDRFIARMYRNEKEPHHVTPGKYDIPFEEVHIPLPKHSQIYGWWIPTSPDAPTIILVHGWGRNLSRMMPYIRQLHPLGYNLLAFDARNHGKSSPEKYPTVETFSEDTLAAVNFVAKSGLVSTSKFGIVGLSIGGGAAINAASSDNRVKSVITVGALSHPIEVMQLEFKKRDIPNFIPWLFFRYMRLRFGIDFNRIAPVNNIPRADADILLIHGDKDDTIPLAQGQMLEKAGNAIKTHLWVVPGKGHSDCEIHPEFFGRVEAFLQTAIPVF